jgi:hypothetical protein
MRPHLFLPGRCPGGPARRHLGRRAGITANVALCNRYCQRSVLTFRSTQPATRVCPPQPGLVRFNTASRHARSAALSPGRRIAKLLTLLRAESRFSAVGTCTLKPGMSADLAEGRHAQERAAAMNGPAGRNSKAIMAPSHAGLTGRPVAVFNGVRHSGGRVDGAEEISPLRVSVLRIAVRQAHTSNALIPQCPALS